MHEKKVKEKVFNKTKQNKKRFSNSLVNMVGISIVECWEKK